MATEKNVGRSKKSTPKTAAPVISEESPKPESADRAVHIPKEIDLNQQIPVYNGFQGRLIYKSSRTKEKFVWPEFGAEQLMELGELRNAKNVHKENFRNNWFMFDDEYAWVLDYLGVTQFYKNALSLSNFDDIFEQSADEIEDTISKLSPGQKSSVAYRARQLIAEGEIDSNKAIAALERSLGIQLVER